MQGQERTNEAFQSGYEYLRRFGASASTLRQIEEAQAAANAQFECVMTAYC